MYNTGTNRTVAPRSWATKLRRSIFGDLFSPTSDTQPTADPRANEVVTGWDNAGAPENFWRVNHQRRDVYRDLEKIDSTDEVISTALDITADCALGHDGITIQTENARVKAVLEALFLRLNMPDLAWQVARNCAKHAHPFYEVVIDRSTGKIINLKDTVYYRVTPKTNEAGDKIPGWLYTKENKTDGMVSQTEELEEWQIVEFPFGRRTGLYAYPALATIRKNWTRLSMLEDGMAIARLTRAYDKLVHRIPVEKSWTTGEILTAIRRYKDSMTKKNFASAEPSASQRLENNPFAVQTDIFLPDDGSQRGGVETLSSVNNQLLRLDDVYYHRERILSRLMVPIQYLQIMSTQKTHLRAGGSLTDAEKQFNRMLLRLQASVRRGLERLCDMELMLNGIVPVKGLYRLELLRITSTDEKMEADIAMVNAQAASYFVEAFGHLPADLMASLFLRLSDEQRKMFDEFITADAPKIGAARVKKLETDAQPKPVPKPAAKKQHMIDLFATLESVLLEEFEAEGEAPDMDTLRQRVSSRFDDMEQMYLQYLEG